MPPAVRRSASIVLALFGALAFVPAATADRGGLTPPRPKSPNAEAITDTYYLVLLVTGIVFVLVHAALVVFIVRYRRRHRPVDAEGPQIHGNTRLEVLWTVVPLLIVVFLVAFVFVKLPEIENVPQAQAAQGENLRIEVEAKQFHFEFLYPDGAKTYETLVVPAGRTVELAVTAPDADVIHSWWIPALGGKIDAIPGRVNHTWFRANAPGEYHGACTEFCGLQHNAMRVRVLAVDEAAWERTRDELVGNGEAQFQSVCAKCHNLTGSQLVGPSLAGNPLLADFRGLAELVREGGNVMPAVGRGWSDAQVASLVRYTRRFAEAGD